MQRVRMILPNAETVTWMMKTVPVIGDTVSIAMDDDHEIEHWYVKDRAWALLDGEPGAILTLV